MAKSAKPAVKKTQTVAKKVTVAAKKVKPVAKKPSIAAKKAVTTAKKVVVVKKAPVEVKKAPVAAKKVAVTVKAKPIEVKKPITVAKAKPAIEKEFDENGFKKRPAAFSKPIGSAKNRRSRARKALIPNKQEDIDDTTPKRTSWNKKPAEKKKKMIIERPTMRSLPETDEPKNTYTGPKKIKYQVEMDIHASPRILFPFLSTSSGLAEWFAPHVDDRNNVFTFNWEGSTQVAKLVSAVENVSVKFHWLDDAQETYFEIKLIQDEMTGDVAIIITDFCLPEEKEENKLLWESQIHDLMHVVGSQF